MTNQKQSVTGALFGFFFLNRVVITAISVVLLALISLVQPLGVLVGFAFVLLVLLVLVRQGSFAEVGFRRPASWQRTLLLGLLIGVVIQLAFAIVIDPLMGRLTGSPVDLSSLDGMRGQAANFAVMLAIGWVVGGFLEEMLFRGYLLQRIRLVLGQGRAASVAAIMLTALTFGLAHGYQDTAGMLSTGLMGVLLGSLFVWNGGNLWLPILVHGFSNMLGLTFIFLSWDKILGDLIF